MKSTIFKIDIRRIVELMRMRQRKRRFVGARAARPRRDGLGKRRFRDLPASRYQQAGGKSACDGDGCNGTDTTTMVLGH